MNLLSRRTFVKMAAASPVIGIAGGLYPTAGHSKIGDLEDLRKQVKFTGDGLSLSPREYVDVLQTISKKRGIEADYYSLGGAVEELEGRMAEDLGKERAIYLPTGTLANQLAARELAGDQTRVIVQIDSHIYNDSGDCAQQLSQLNLLPLAHDSATFTLDEVEETIDRTSSGRVTTGIGVIMIESPVRRRLGELFDYREMGKICSFARENGIKTHLDGARLYMASGYTGISPKEYASHFDTVYVSLWKYFNAASGAILAGPKEVIDNMYHTRRMFGGGLPEAWPFAAMVLHYIDDFEGEFSRAVKTVESFFTLLQKHSSFEVQRIPNGSNIFKLIVKGANLHDFRKRLRAKNVILPAPNSRLGGFVIKVNPTLNRTNAKALAALFAESV